MEYACAVVYPQNLEIFHAFTPHPTSFRYMRIFAVCCVGVYCSFVSSMYSAAVLSHCVMYENYNTARRTGIHHSPHTILIPMGILVEIPTPMAALRYIQEPDLGECLRTQNGHGRPANAVGGSPTVLKFYWRYCVKRSVSVTLRQVYQSASSDILPIGLHFEAERHEFGLYVSRVIGGF